MNQVIQFIHPGGEHNINTGEIWNKGSHKRKYLKVSGDYLQDISTKPLHGNVYFWGEWEAQSKVTKICNQLPLPQYIFEPYYCLPIGLINSDPFIFGDQFYYCICKQGHYPILRNLQSGDIILFGSNLNGHFVLDTVFVIKDYFEYKIKDIKNINAKYNDVFYEVSLIPISLSSQIDCKELIKDDVGLCVAKSCDDENDYYPSITIKKYRIYNAVMYDERKKFEGLFSYSPCLPNSSGAKGFSRPVINSSALSQTLNQGLKIIDAKSMWHDVTKQVLDSGLNLMIKNKLPQKLYNSVMVTPNPNHDTPTLE